MRSQMAQFAKPGGLQRQSFFIADINDIIMTSNGTDEETKWDRRYKFVRLDLPQSLTKQRDFEIWWLPQAKAKEVSYYQCTRVSLETWVKV